jgi:phosphatidylethanolamine-binding protein (PEBP) family uncharacterized protein
MDTDDIVPTILDVVPPSKITVTYPNEKSVELGTVLTPQQVKDDPEVRWDPTPDKYYTLLMIDPDAPSRRWAFLADVNHWLVANIKGCDLSTGEVLAEYAGAGPPKGTGFHRYIFVLFEHDQRVEFDEVKITKGTRLQRTRFSMKKFQKKYELDRVVAWNYFKAQAGGGDSEHKCVCL